MTMTGVLLGAHISGLAPPTSTFLSDWMRLHAGATPLVCDTCKTWSSGGPMGIWDQMFSERS